MGCRGGSLLSSLIDTVDRYGDEIEYDLHRELGIDLIDFFRGVYPWRKLARALPLLPSNSRYACAIASDEERAAQWIAAGGADQIDEEAGPALTEYTPEVSRLDTVIDLLGLLVGAEANKAGRRFRFPPSKRPDTAFSRAADRHRAERIGALVAEVEAASGADG